MSTEDISKSLRVATMLPLDAKQIALTLANLTDLGENNAKAFTYYDGLRVLCLEDRIVYEWKEIQYGENGAIPGGFSYPPETIVNNQNYSNKIFNFVQVSSKSSGSQSQGGLSYVEPSVNIEFKENETPNEALYFGRGDIGFGEEDIALIKTDFVAQSGYNMLDGINNGAEIKLLNATNGNYLGHFILTQVVFGSYQVLTIVEKGDWEPLGDYNAQILYIEVLKESEYAVNLSGNVIQLRRGTTITDSIDLSPLLQTSNATIVSGVLNPANGIVTFTLSDASTFDVDFSALLTAETAVKRNSVLSPNGAAVYQNIFVALASQASVGQGFYAADLNTNYDSNSIQGFPYPANRDFVCFRYGNQLYMAIKKTISSRRIFNLPDQVLGFSFVKFNTAAEKNMSKVAYLKILTRKTALQNFNSGYDVYPIWLDAGTNVPLNQTGGSFNETYLLNGTNEIDAYPFVTKIYQENLSLKKSVNVPYTVTAADNGKILFASGTGNIIIPAGLPKGFNFGVVQEGSDTDDIQIVADGAVTLEKPNAKTAYIKGQYYSVYIMDADEFVFSGPIATAVTNNFVLLGDLKDA